MWTGVFFTTDVLPLPGTTAYIPMYWYNPAVPSTIAALILLMMDQTIPYSTHIDLTALNLIFIGDYPGGGDPSVDFRASVTPKPSGSNQNIQIRVSMAKEGATLYFQYVARSILLNAANNFTATTTKQQQPVLFLIQTYLQKVLKVQLFLIQLSDDYLIQLLKPIMD